MNKSGIIKKLSLEEADVVLLKVPYEGTVSRKKGASRGPAAVCGMLRYQVEEWDHILKKNIEKNIKIIERGAKISKLKPEGMAGKIEKETLSILRQKKFPVILGGEHTVSLGAIAATQKYFGNVTVIQIDAHADLRYDNSDYEEDKKRITKYAHSCVMRRVYELGCDLIQIGIRSMSLAEANFVRMEKLEKNIFYVPIKANFRKIISRCQNKRVYLTIDIDGFDPSIMPATGTPEPGGLSWDWGLAFFKELFKKKNVVGFDIVEVSPRTDCQRTEYAAAKLLYHLIGLKFLKQL